jgi:DNA-binding MarR family transcriptional regulator
VNDDARALLKMMETPAPKARDRGAATSKRAAANLAGKVGKRRASILLAMGRLLSAGRFMEGITTYELADAMGIDRDKVSPNMSKLVAKGWVRKAAKNRPADGKHDEAMCYLLSEAGIQMAQDLEKNGAISQLGGDRKVLSGSRLGPVVDTSDEIWKHLLDNPSWPAGLEQMRNYERDDDMGEGILRVFVDDQGDVYVSTHISHSARFCTKVGGGHSLRTRAALLYLAFAIMKDNGGKP